MDKWYQRLRVGFVLTVAVLVIVISVMAASGKNIHYEYHIIETAFYLYVSLSPITLKNFACKQLGGAPAPLHPPGYAYAYVTKWETIF